MFPSTVLAIVLYLLGNIRSTRSFSSWLIPKRPVSRDTETLKKDLLLEISKSRKKGNADGRNAILDAIGQLETKRPGRSTTIKTQDVEGMWSLVFSTQESMGIDKNDRFVDVISARLYKLFFKVAPFLAGRQDEISRGFQISNRQNLDIKNGVVNNVVNIRLLPTLTLEINVDGTIYLINGSSSSSSSNSGDSLLLDVTFTSFSISMYIGSDGRGQKLMLPLPKPKGSLATTFCDGDLRISRGGRGGVFVAKKMPTCERF